MSDFVLRRVAKRYADDDDYRLEVDLALGVKHYPPHRSGQCRLCDEQLNRPMVCPRCGTAYHARENGCCWKHGSADAPDPVPLILREEES